jgi:hypothetical protein
MGYRFVLRKLTYPSKVKPGGELRFTSWWENKGVAPCYRPLRLAFRLHRPEGDIVVVTDADIRSWLPGDSLYDSTVNIPADTAQGQYDLQIGILDEQANKSRVKLAIEGRQPDGWYSLGKIRMSR